MVERTYQCSFSVGFHLIEKANGIEYLYAWLDRHPDVCSMVINLGSKGGRKWKR